MRQPRYNYDGRDARADDLFFFGPGPRRSLSPPRRDLSPRGPHFAHQSYRSRYTGRYDGPDRRSRSPRDRSPFDRGQYNDGDRRRSTVDNRSPFPNNRDGFRDPPAGREPPRGPKALLDRPLEPPAGPRGGGYLGRGGRGGRGRGYRRDDSRDRGRDRDFDPRERPPYRDERSRERDRDWRDRDRDGRDNFRGRRPSPPLLGRGRSPIGRDFRDNRDPPLGVDVERARRGSRDGPLSAGSSNSDPPFAPSGYRGGYSRGSDRGRGRGRGDYDRGRGGGRGGFYDDRDRFGQRSRSNDRGGWAREREDRDRGDRYPPDPDRMLHRESRNERELLPDRARDVAMQRPEQVTREPSVSTTKDMSPPPIAPSAPAFGSVPTRQPSNADLQSLTGKAPPTGPRALTEERQVPQPGPSGLSTANERLPPTGPSHKLSMPPGSPPIPTAPRAQIVAAQQKQQRSSKQWINPAIAPKKVPESPKSQRSQSFVSQQGRPQLAFRPQSSHSDQHPDLDRRPQESSYSDHKEPERQRPRSSDGHPESPATAADRRNVRPSRPNAVPSKADRIAYPARASIERDTRPSQHSLDDRTRHALAREDSMPRSSEHKDADRQQPSTKPTSESLLPKKSRMRVPTVRVTYFPKKVSPALDQSDSEDEDMGFLLDREIEQHQKEVENLARQADEADTELPLRQALMVADAGMELATMSEGINEAFRSRQPGPESGVTASDKVREWLTKPSAAGQSGLDSTTSADQSGAEHAASAPSVNGQTVGGELDSDHPMLSPSEKQVGATTTLGASSKPSAPETSVELTSTVSSDPKAPIQSTEVTAPERQPKVEEVETGLPPTITAPAVPDAAVDTDMPDAGEAADVLAPLPKSLPATNGMSHVQGSMLSPYPMEGDEQASRVTTPGHADEDDDETEIEEVDFATIETVRQYMATPPLDDLPHFDVRPWYQSKKVRKLQQASEGLSSFIISQINDEYTIKLAEQTERRRDYRDKYEYYLRFTMSNDPTAIKSRDHFNHCNAPEGGKPATAPESKPEGGRRGGRFATELDVEYAIQQSIREEKERQEREERAQKEKYRSEKEAVIPDMYWTEEERDREVYLDHTGYLPVERLIAAWQVLPPVVNFTEEEAARFEKAYLEFPKQWGKIASEVPKRDFGACIQYYYSKKKELNLKEKLKKQPKKRKKSKKQRSSALVSELGNPENENEESQDTGENGERRRPRRAAAPTWGYEATPAADSDGTTPAATPGRRGAGSKNDSGAEKTEVKKRRTRVPKDKDGKAAKPAQQALAPTPAPAAAKTNRSRSNSRAQAPPDWVQPPSGVGEIGRIPMKFDMPPVGMQPPMPHVTQPSLASPERIPLPLPSSISEVMAPPSLRPEPPPPPANVPTFDLGHGADRMRTPQQASSYWSVSEATDFPGLLRAFGTDWGAIATHMQTKTAVMVKNYYVRQKDNAKPEWETFATEADNKKLRGEKRPAPPVISAGPRKRYDTPLPGAPPTTHRILAAAEPLSEDSPQSKMESPGPGMGAPLPQGQQFTTRFQVPIAQAPAGQPPLAQPVAQQQMQAQQPPQSSGHVVTQAMSPGNRPLRAPVANFAYPERDEPPVSQAPSQQAVRHSQKATAAVPVSSPGTAPVPQPPVTEAMSSRATWQADLGSQVAQQLTQFSQAREPRDRAPPRLESHLREPPRHADRTPVRLKQESDMANHYDTPFADPQQSQRGVPPRAEPPTALRQQQQQQQSEPPRAVAPAPQPFAPVAQAQPVRSLLGESVPPQQRGTPNLSMSGMPRPMAVSMHDAYAGVSAPVLQTPPAPTPPASSRPAEPKKSSLFSLLNDDPAPAPPPKRVADVSSAMKSSSTPPPQGMERRPPPPTSATPLRREGEPTGYGYRSQGPPSSAIPSLKPYNTQSPQPHHPSIPRPMVSTTDSPVVGPERSGYFSRHEYGQAHQVQSTNSPQGHPYLSQSQHSQQSPMGYQPQSGYPPYGSSVSQQPHSASPTPPFSAHQPPRDRRDAPAGRDGPWQQAQGLAPQQQSASAMQHQHAGWPGTPAPHQQQPPKPTQQSTHAASPWGAQHGAPIKPQVTAAMSSQPAWAQAPQGQQQHHLGLRDDRGQPVYGLHEARGPPAGMVQHQHHRSLTGQFPPQELRRQEPRPPPGQASYASYPGPADRQQVPQRDPRDLRDPRDPGPGRSYTPTPMYDVRSQQQQPPPPPAGQSYAGPAMQEQMREMQYREMAARDQEQRDAAVAAQQLAARQQQQQSGLQPRLRPQDAYDRPERFH